MNQRAGAKPVDPAPGGVVVLISGRGSNMRALVEAGLPVTAVLSNRPDAPGLAYARERGIPALIVDHKAYATREDFDRALMHAIEPFAPRLVALAGFMRVLTAEFVARYEGRLVNIHPSLLPAFPGLDTHRRALEAGVKLHGTTVHFVTPALDHGPIIIQAAVPVRPDDDEPTLAARVLESEHEIYRRAVRWFLDGLLRVRDGVVRVEGGAPQWLGP